MTLTAEQKRQAAQKHYNASLELCPARQLLEAISSKWVTLIMLALVDGKQRHSDLQKRIAGASQKMLTSTLRSLERDGLVSRHVTLSVPMRTDYELTPRGHSLLRIVIEMKEWAEENMADVATSRMEHDRHKLAFNFNSPSDTSGNE
ncbi:DNA-binding HxlR family transcriptional regulator [Arthrobacter pascens]|jgi:DNA-binding HxlR family transcriptional regulator|uniref:winged helix-turn-helix transcriptional regulator n=1 Tax=Arthrobacter pascens TaxID=1677 RepID=UPI0027873212|nr:helix-turn-helix domain-containing protein [Arthrobacter pascens]MDQ0635958.1 DNA-binding HxlR family transcriptional regulator [Arthrobacter pascens]